MLGTAAGMIEIPGGTFRMGADKHYAEEAPSHRVTVDPFPIDATPNRSIRRRVMWVSGAF